MRVALVHFWLVGMRGGEKVLEALCRLYPDAVIITHVADRTKLSPLILSHEIRETFIAKLPGAKKHYQKYLPLMPRALEQLDMSEFDLIISSESGPAKGIIPRPDALHLCYCHSPMRYIWDQYHTYRARAGRLSRLMMPLISPRLRLWDVVSAARVDQFIANSSFVAQRIQTYYRREAEVIAPPVAVDEFRPAPPDQIGDHYLMAGELVSYKRPDLAVAAFAKSGRRLRIVGDGAERRALEKIATPNIEFTGRLPFAQLKEEFARCRALIFPGEEDFGIIPVEVMASGRPVVAYGRGGVLDSVIPGETGVFFDRQTPDALEEAIAQLESGLLQRLDPGVLQSHAGQFSEAAFTLQIRQAIADAMQRFSKPGTRVRNMGAEHAQKSADSLV
ncbi:glycosyltransferase [Xinfangfangia sp. D13-10-4-6]|uniref:glycosyltransferase n=1 Tax=Pseudogemmobacter hezensis TaxID=2737662 RepID=UPI001553643B|nr:glycosyltransferase [Pseudogemmobacter hezensis]NPD16072.1 glycosyltransferase [Pseudogemmobacter hezensis]